MVARSNPTKVVINARFIDQPMTGVQRFALQISLHLKDLLPNVEFIAPRAPRGGSNVDHGLPLKRVGRFSGHAWEQLSLPRYLAQTDNATLINLCNTAPIFYNNKISTHHDITYIRHPESFSLKFRLLYRTISPLFLRKSKAVVTVSDFSKREICSHYGISESKITIAPNAVDSRFKPTPSSQRIRPYFLAVSSPAAHKNFDRVISAYERWDNRENVDLRIVGSASGVFASTAIDPPPKGVIFMGRVNDDDLITLYSDALGFIFPSVYEGFGIPPLEAQACGCPVIAAKIPPLNETLGSSAHYFDPYSISEIADCMTTVASDQSLRRELIERGTSNVARYSWRDSAQTIAALVAQAV